MTGFTTEEGPDRVNRAEAIQESHKKQKTKGMLVLPTPTTMKRSLIAFVAGVVLCPAADASQKNLVTLTAAEYREVIDRSLACPPLARGTDGTQVCLRILPPGHRPAERELLLIVRTKSNEIELEVRQPRTSLARAARAAKSADPEAWRPASFETEVLSWRTSDPRITRQVLGRSWRTISSRIVPSDEWLTDPTTYQFRAESVSGTVAIEMNGPGAKVAKQNSSFLAWAEGVRQRAEDMLRSNATAQR